MEQAWLRAGKQFEDGVCSNLASYKCRKGGYVAMRAVCGLCCVPTGSVPAHGKVVPVTQSD